MSRDCASYPPGVPTFSVGPISNPPATTSIDPHTAEQAAAKSQPQVSPRVLASGAGSIRGALACRNGQRPKPSRLCSSMSHRHLSSRREAKPSPPNRPQSPSSLIHRSFLPAGSPSRPAWTPARGRQAVIRGLPAPKRMPISALPRQSRTCSLRKAAPAVSQAMPPCRCRSLRTIGCVASEPLTRRQHKRLRPGCWLIAGLARSRAVALADDFGIIDITVRRKTSQRQPPARCRVTTTVFTAAAARFYRLDQ